MKALGAATIAGTAAFLFSVVALHVLQPQRSARDEAVSYYAHGAWGWLLTVGLIAWGLGSLAVVAALARSVTGRWATAGRWLLGVWGVGVLLGGTFPADPPGRWNTPPTVAGMIHGNAALLAFLTLPLGALALARGFREDERWRPSHGVYLALAFAALLSFGLFMASLAPVFVRPGPPILLGLSERVLLLSYAAWLVALGAGVTRRAGV